MSQYNVTYDSVSELCNVAAPYLSDGTYKLLDKEFAGAGSCAEVKNLAINGWDAESDTALSIAESTIETVSQDHDLPAFSPVWDVAGSEVDVARYLSGEPENMIDYAPVKTPRHGRVIVLCASVSFSGSVSTRTIKRRGHTVAALAFALSRMGFAIELWADLSAQGSRITNHMRVLVKGANDELDPARIMFAFSHPAMLRGLCMPAMHSFPEDIRKALGVGYSYGSPADPKQDLPEGTIYLPSVCSDRDVPEAEAELVRHLRDLGIIED